jgi:guanylate kinase
MSPRADTSPADRRRGVLFVVSAPSGGGKTTLVKAALATDPSLSLSVSCTTRPPRPGEVDGRDYFFVTRDEFARRREAGDFVEWAEIFGNLYGTLRSTVEEALDGGRDLLLDVDVLGMQSIKQQCHDDAVGVFVVPPGPILAELEHRLRVRGSDSEPEIQRRLGRAAFEIGEAERLVPPIYDYIVVNDSIDRASADLLAIVRAERLRRRTFGVPSAAEIEATEQAETCRIGRASLPKLR